MLSIIQDVSLNCSNSLPRQLESIYMNKTELIAKMAEYANLSKAEAGRALKSFETAVVEAMQSGDKISILGFGSFETSKRAARTGRNPQTGKEIRIPEANVPKFKAGKALKDSVN